MFSKVQLTVEYEVIDELKLLSGYKIQELCNDLGISRASYYKWKKRRIPDKELQDLELATLIKEYNVSFNGILGYRRMTIYINRLNHKDYSWKYVRHIMRKINIKSRIRRKKYNYISNRPEQVGENILDRNFKADYPNQKWCTDVTEFKVPGQNQKVYLSAIIDLFDKSIVSHKISFRNDNKLVFDTYDLAINNNEGAKPIFHSDRGFQYTSKVFKFKLDKTGMIQSMSRVSKCIDNGPIEAFWGTLKAESFYGLKFEDLDSLIYKINEYIFFYNNHRIQANLKSMTPNEFRYHAYSTNVFF